MNTDLSNDELLDVPLGNLRPGELKRAFAVKADNSHKVEEAANNRVISLAERRQQEETEHERETVALHEREAHLLQAIHEREEALQIEAKRQDDRAIKLADGRRVYVDGDKFRDADGHELTGADRAQAEVLNVENPHATTWQEHQRLQKDKEQIETMRQNVEAMENGPADPKASEKLTAYERQLQSSRDADLAKQPTMKDYGSGDYAADLGGLISSYPAAPSADATQPASAAVQAQPAVKPKAAAPSF